MSLIVDKYEKLRAMINRHENYQAVFGSPQGQQVLAHLIKVSGVTSSNFVAGDPTATAFKEGQRHLVLSILKCVNRDTQELIKQIEKGMQDET